MDDQEEEIESNISESKEGFDDIRDSKKGVEDRNDSAEQVDVFNYSENLLRDESDPKSDPNVATHTTNRISATDTTNGISKRKLYPLFIKPVIQAVVRTTETRSRASCGSPSFAVMSVSPTQIGNRYFQSKQLQYRKKGQES